jgi:hypothetical protein
MTVHDHAVVATGTPERYAKQLATHLGRKLEVTEEAAGTRIAFPDGDCLMTCSPGELRLDATGADDAALDKVRDVVGRHLERFGARGDLVVAWAAASGEPG